MKQNKNKIIQLRLNTLFNHPDKAVLALGAELKGNYCLVKKNLARLHYGFEDLKTPRDYNKYKASIKNSLKVLKFKPQIIAHDLNPQFLSSRLAQELKKEIFKKSKILPVQHHYAHVVNGIAACKLDNRREVIGVACDGTGLGDDQRVWGFEFFICNLKKYTRVGHLDYIYLPGADMAVKEPWRVAVALLYKAYKDKIFTLNIPWLKKKKYEIGILLQMMKKGINSPLASSGGRLFDGVAALIGIHQQVEFQAQAAIALEKYARRVIDKEKQCYPFRIKRKKGTFVVDPDLMVRSIVKDLLKSSKKEIIAARFHNTFSQMIIDMCIKIRQVSSINNLVLSGGVFFNKIVRKKVQEGLAEKGFHVHYPPDILLGDSGLSLGQAVIAYVFGSSRKD